MQDQDSQSQNDLRQLIKSVQASHGKLNLLVAICDNQNSRNEIIFNYETELSANGVSCHRVNVTSQQTSLSKCLLDLVERESGLNSLNAPVLVTLIGADALSNIRLDETQSTEEQFCSSLRGTLKSWQEFTFSILIWLTPAMANSLAKQAPDFWSWRNGVFDFSQPITLPVKRRKPLPTPTPFVIPVELQKRMDELNAQDPESPLRDNLMRDIDRAQRELLGVNSFSYSKIEKLHQKDLELFERQIGTHHPILASSLNKLAELYRAQGKYREAEPLYLRLLEIAEQRIDSYPHSIVERLSNLALIYYSQGKYSNAEPLYLRWLEIWEQVYGTDHEFVSRILNTLAGIYLVQGKYSEAEPLYLRSLEIRGPQHSANGLNNLAECYRSQGKYSEAEPLYLRSLEIRERQRQPEVHPDPVVWSLNNLATLYKSQGKFSEAELLYLRAIEIRGHQLKSDESYTIIFCPSFTISLYNLAEFYRSQGIYCEAESLSIRLLEIIEEQGIAPPHVPIILNNLALLYESQGKYSEAEPLYLRAIQIFENVFGSDHPNTVTVRKNYEIMCKDMKDK